MADMLAARADVKTRLRITDTTDDALLDDLIEQVSAWVQDRCRRRFIAEDNATYIVDVAAGSTIYVPRGIRAVDALELATSNQPDTGGTYSAVTAADIMLRPSSAYRRPGWPADRIVIAGASARLTRPLLNGARVTGDWDFATTPLPIVAVVEDATIVAYNARQGGTGTAIGEGATPAPSWAEYFADGSPAAATLRRYTAGSAVGIG